MPRLASARYGKDNVRVYKVHRDEATGVQTVTEMTVTCLLEGQIETSYTEADNSVVVATDSMKNTIYIKAKEHPVNPPELFASILGQHFLDTYPHITTAHIKVVVHRWTRMVVDGEPHPHSFYRDGNETRNVEAAVSRDGGISLRSGIVGLTVLKSTGSEFHGFVRDEYTTLPETWDRILSTDVDASWTWKAFPGVDAVRDEYTTLPETWDRILSTDVDASWTWKAFPGVDAVRDATPRFDAAWEAARNITMKTFAEDESPSVQNTMYKMCEQILEAVPETELASYSLPNKHYFEIDLSWHKGLKNTGKDAEVYAPQSGPNGLIKCEVARS